MTVVDTSVWVNHFRVPDAELSKLIELERVAMHPFVVGELACGNLRMRTVMIGDFRRLPAVPVASDEEVHRLLEGNRLWGKGLSFIDMHLLAAARKSGFALLTADRILGTAASALGINTHLRQPAQ